MSELVHLGDVDLFGNQVAEDENDDVFRAYALDRDEVQAFSDTGRRICFARAYKGEGKSALLRLASARIQRQATAPPLLVQGPVTAFAPTLESDDFDAWVRAWKGALFGRIAHAVGSTLGFAWTDDDMSLVEEAERKGARPRSFVGSLLDRFSPKLKAGALEASASKVGIVNAEAIVQRWATDSEPIWLLIDDVDQSFENTAKYRTKVAAFFVACRQAVNVVPQLRIRAAVRPSVWTTIKLHFEALSHVEQYMTDLSWSEDSMRRLLARRIEGYLVRRDRWSLIAEKLPTDIKQRDRALIALAFQDPVRWGKEADAVRPPLVMLHTLSKHRPRWMVELCSIAAGAAVRAGSELITRDHVFDQLGDFGRRRIQDTVAEFRSQCPQIEELISAFQHAPEEMSTAELLEYIQNRILNHLTPSISGVVGSPTNLTVAAFLFEIGVFFARRDHSDGSYDHISYSNRPSLLRSRANVDDGLRWEIHPVFRQALEIRDAGGRESKSALPRRRRIVR